MLVPLVPIYHYSPDRMPTPTPTDASSLTAPAAGSRSESPKRKYSEAMTVRERVPASLDVDVPDPGSDSYCLSEGKCDSPRSKVAERFEALEIDQAEDAPRKRVKTLETDRAARPSGLEVTPKQPPRLRFDICQNRPATEIAFEIAETPGCKPEAARPSTPSPLAKQIEQSKSKSISPIVKISPKRMRSPPPPKSTSPSKHPSNGNPSDSSQESNDSADMTWQDSEITGHEIHAALGDDGEGINGIGFRPTPAIAHARSQKRKHQLSEWRAREAKEARQRRFEKRQGCSVDVKGDDESHGRMVRFEEF